MHLSYFELDLQPQEDGQAVAIVTAPPGDTARALVLVERLGGEGGFEATVYGLIDGSDLSSRDDPSVAVYASSVAENVGQISLRLRATTGGRFRVFMGWVSRKLRRLIERLPCDACRLAVSAAIRAALGMAGIPVPGGDELSDRALETLRAFADGDRFGDVSNFLADVLGEDLWELLREWLPRLIDKLLGAGRAFGQLAKMLCEAIGLCP